MAIGARMVVTILCSTALALAACGDAGSGGGAPATASGVPPAAATARPAITPRPPASPGEGYKDDYGY